MVEICLAGAQETMFFLYDQMSVCRQYLSVMEAVVLCCVCVVFFSPNPLTNLLHTVLRFSQEVNQCNTCSGSVSGVLRCLAGGALIVAVRLRFSGREKSRC